MSNPIDELYKKAFPKKEHPYQDSYWEQVASDLPSSQLGGFSSAGVLKVAASLVGIGAVVGGSVFLSSEDTSHKNLPQSEKIASNNTTKQSSTTQALINDVGEEQKQEKLVENSRNNALEENNADWPSSVKENSTASTGSSSASNQQEDEELSTPNEVGFSSEIDVNKKELFSKGFQPILPRTRQSAVGVSLVDNSVPLHTTETNLRVASVSLLRTRQLTESVRSNEMKLSSNKTEFSDNIPKNKNGNLYGELIGGYHYIDYDGFKGFEEISDLKDILLKIKSHSESEVGINVGYQKNGFKISTGLHLNNLQQSYFVSYKEMTQRTEQHVQSHSYIDGIDSSFVEHEYGIIQRDGKEFLGVIKSIYDHDTTWAQSFDTTFTTSIDETEKTEDAAYRVQYLQIPVELGYQFQIRKVLFELNTGVTVGILTKFSGNLFDEETGKTKGMIEGDELNNLTWKVNLSAGVGYQFTPQIAFMVKPTMTSSLNGPFKSDNIHAYNYTGYGLRAALRYNF